MHLNFPTVVREDYAGVTAVVFFFFFLHHVQVVRLQPLAALLMNLFLASSPPLYPENCARKRQA